MVMNIQNSVGCQWNVIDFKVHEVEKANGTESTS